MRVLSKKKPHNGCFNFSIVLKANIKENLFPYSFIYFQGFKQASLFMSGGSSDCGNQSICCWTLHVTVSQDCESGCTFGVSEDFSILLYPTNPTIPNDRSLYALYMLYLLFICCYTVSSYNGVKKAHPHCFCFFF